MFGYNSILFAALVIATFPFRGVSQWFGGVEGFPSCASSCWNSSCLWTDRGSCFCTNATLVDSMNSCVAASSCANSDKEAVYQKIAQLCVDAGHQVTAAPEATFSATSGGTLSTYTGNNGPWGVGIGPFGGNWGPWGSSGPWTSGPWTNWWAGSGCPGTAWPGWTSGEWNSNAPWTAWTACTATTTATVTFTTTTTNGGTTGVITGTTFGVKVAEGVASAKPATTTKATTTTGSSGSLASRDYGSVRWALVLGGLAASLLGAIVVL